MGFHRVLSLTGATAFASVNHRAAEVFRRDLGMSHSDLTVFRELAVHQLDTGHGLNVLSVAESLGLPYETVRRRLRSMAGRGLVSRGDDGLYRASPRSIDQMMASADRAFLEVAAPGIRRMARHQPELMLAAFGDVFHARPKAYAHQTPTSPPKHGPHDLEHHAHDHHDGGHQP